MLGAAAPREEIRWQSEKQDAFRPSTHACIGCSATKEGVGVSL